MADPREIARGLSHAERWVLCQCERWVLHGDTVDEAESATLESLVAKGLLFDFREVGLGYVLPPLGVAVAVAAALSAPAGQDKT